jgi:hypothetical protein
MASTGWTLSFQIMCSKGFTAYGTYKHVYTNVFDITTPCATTDFAAYPYDTSPFVGDLNNYLIDDKISANGVRCAE